MQRTWRSKLKMPAWYCMYLHHSNFALHASAGSLNRHLRLNNKGELVGLDCAPQEFDEWFRLVNDAALIALQARNYLDELFPKSRSALNGPVARPAQRNFAQARVGEHESI